MYALIAVVVGLVAGLARGGRFSHLASRPFRFGWLLVSGLVLQVLTELAHLPHLLDMTAVLVSYATLAMFAAGNLNLGGMGLVAVGLLLNIVPIALNGGMPVRPSAIVRSGIVRRADQVHTLRFGGKRHLERPGDQMMVLADILPDWVFHEVLSFGDLVLSMGIAAVVVNLLQPPRRHRRLARPPDTEGSAWTGTSNGGSHGSSNGSSNGAAAGNPLRESDAVGRPGTG